MGYRHQIYLKLPYQYEQLTQTENKATQKYVKSNIIALHHPWLYGFGPLSRLKQFFTFYKNGKNLPYFVFSAENSPTTNPERVFLNLYSLDLEQGKCDNAFLLTNEKALNPLKADNNDGITIIDISNPDNLKYAFMFFGKTQDDIPAFTPLCAFQYARDYYNENIYKTQNFSKEEIKKCEIELTRLTGFFDSDYSLLTKEELENMFPAMFLESFFI